jgi:hypothetical protein
MFQNSIKGCSAISRPGERGAALISSLLMSILMLLAGAALILTTAMSGTNSIDATAETHAYYAAEAGLQATLNVLQGHGPVGSPSPSFRNAVNSPTLSPWLVYNGATPARVFLGPNAAYSVVVSDPDATPALEEPGRLLVDVTGYGPRSARKQMRLILQGVALNIPAPAPMVVRGADGGVMMSRFEIGSSNAKKYTGADRAGVEAQKPAFAMSVQDLTLAQSSITKNATVATPQLGVLDIYTAPAGVPSVKTPPFFVTADAMRIFIADALALAEVDGKVYASFDGYAGSVAAPQFTFVTGDCRLDGGAGLLIVRGELITKGNPQFAGIVLVLGEGRVTKAGGGNGTFDGTLMIAKFDSTGGFLAPSFDVSGGGTADLEYDSEAVRRALTTPGHRVIAVGER